jgi:hypothetical protein
MPKLVDHNLKPKEVLRRKEIYLTDKQLVFFEKDAKANGFSTSKAYIETVLEAFRMSKKGVCNQKPVTIHPKKQ